MPNEMVLGEVAVVVAAAAAAAASPWTCRFVLRNPHSLCYANSSIRALLHATHLSNTDFGPLQGLKRLLENSIRKGVMVLLSQILIFRSLTPGWCFDATQRDAAEYLHSLLEATQLVPAFWDKRGLFPDGVRLIDQGVMPIGMSIADCGTLQGSILRWHGQSELHALTSASTLLCIQVDRYTLAGKIHHRLQFSDFVQVPCFTDGMNITWYRYQVVSVIMHFGRYTTSGHYRALLRVGNSWHLADDGRDAHEVQLVPGYERNAYVLWLIRQD